MLRAVVIDDELPAREELAALLEETGEVVLVGSCANAIQAIRTIKATRPDVIFLDIQMPRLDGLRMLGMIDPEIMPCVIFVTACEDYALNAFDENAIDYLLKPVQPERMARAIERVRTVTRKRGASSRHTAAPTKLLVPAMAILGQVEGAARSTGAKHSPGG